MNIAASAASSVGGAPGVDRRLVERLSGTDPAVLIRCQPGRDGTRVLVDLAVRLQSAVAVPGPAGTARPGVVVLMPDRRAVHTVRAAIVDQLPTGAVPPVVATPHGWAFTVVRRERISQPAGPGASAAGPVRILSGPEQEAAIRELLRGRLADGHLGWPVDFGEAMRTRGMARAIRDATTALITRGVSVAEFLAEFDNRTDVPGRRVHRQRQALIEFAREYADSQAQRGVIDYSDLLAEAAAIIAEATAGTAHRAAGWLPETVLVSAFEEFDDAGVRLLRRLTGAGVRLRAFADPAHAIFEFRGANPDRVRTFPDDFTVAGTPGVVITLPPAQPLPAELVGVLHPDPSRPRAAASVAPGVIEISPTRTAEHQAIAGALHVAHERSERPLAWAEMAVIVRSTSSLAPIRRALLEFDIPVLTDGEDQALATDPAVAPLLALCDLILGDPAAGSMPPGDRLTGDRQTGDRQTGTATAGELWLVSPESVRAALTGPVFAVDPSALRGLLRRLRAHLGQTAGLRVAAGVDSGLPPSGAQTLVSLLTDPQVLRDFRDPDLIEITDQVRRAAACCATARSLVLARGSVSEVLWSLWQGQITPEQRHAYGAGDGPGHAWTDRLTSPGAGRRADRDCDALVALFDEAARHDERLLRTSGVAAFLADLRLHDVRGTMLTTAGAAADCVAVLTAHRAKGRTWPFVIVADLIDGVWPTAARPDPADVLGLEWRVRRGSALAAERRLFSFACSRATNEIMLTAVDSGDGEVAASRFLADLVGGRVHLPAAQVRPGGALNARRLIAELRRTAADVHTSAGLRAAAVERLALLAQVPDDSGQPLIPQADPGRWWGGRPTVEASTPWRDPTSPLRLSASQLAGIHECSLRWFLDHEAQAQVTRGSSTVTGSLVHALAEALHRELIAPQPEQITQIIDSVVDRIGFAGGWIGQQQRRSLDAIVTALLTWVASPRPTRAVGVELPFSVELAPVDLRGGHGNDGGRMGNEGEPAERVQVRGVFDRVEVDTADPTAIHVIDFKTSRVHPSRADLGRDIQTALYRAAVDAGAVPAIPGARCASVTLVQLRNDAAPGVPVEQQGTTSTEWLADLLDRALTLVRGEQVQATVNAHCRTCAYRIVCPAQPEGRAVVR